MSEIIPLEDRAVLKVNKMAETTTGGIIIPQEYLERLDMAQLEAEVVALGEFCFQDCTVKPEIGDTVLIAKYAGLLYAMDGEEYRVVQPRDIVGIKR